MRGWSLIAAVAAVVTMSGPAQSATLADFSSVLVFGDSLVDSGNARIGSLTMGLPDPAPPAAGYYEGRFSNDFNYADRIAQGVDGQPATAFLQGGTNFAVGGATAAFSPAETSPSFLPQLGFFGSTMQPIASDALVLVTFGGNDVRAQMGNPGMVDFSATIAAFTAGLGQLVGAGARNIVVTGLPDIGRLPGALAAGFIDPTIPLLATQRSKFLNNRFAVVSDQVEQASGANITFFNLIGFQNLVTANPARYGLTAPLNTTTPCQAVPGAVVAGCDGFLYFDPIHPTGQAHSAIAAGIERQLLTGAVPEPSTWAMMICGFGLIGALLRRRVRLGFAKPQPMLLPS